MSREIEDIKTKIDIVDLIGSYVKLTPAGANHRALCPFHNEKTPSMMVNRAKQIWRCFGCNEGGDIFSFYMKIENVEFGEALRALAQKAGVVLSRTSAAENNLAARLLDICDLAARYWRQVFLQSPRAEKARAYAAKRGLTEEVMEDFKIGYAVESWDDLFQFLLKKGYSEKEIFLAGLSAQKNDGRSYYDRFRDRLMFPIAGLSGRIVGFGGRTLNAAETAKYINTPQTAVYNKSAVLYGLYQAKEEIKKNDLAVLVEGYMDLVPSHQAGVKNVVAISGTALTGEQVRILKRYSHNLALALDMDQAGQRAALRSIEMALAAEMEVKVITLPFGKDPGECIQNNPDDWRAAIAAAKPIMRYYFEQEKSGQNQNDPKQKKLMAVSLLAKIANLSSAIERDYWLKELSVELSISENVLREEMAGMKNRSVANRTQSTVSPSHHANNQRPDSLLFKRILALIFVEPDNFDYLAANLPPEFLIAPEITDLYKTLLLFYNKNNELFGPKADLTDHIDLYGVFVSWLKENNVEMEKIAADFLAEAFFLSQKDFNDLSGKDIRSELILSIQTVKNDYFQDRINFLKAEMEKLEKTGAKAEADKVFTELNDLIHQKHILKL